MGLTVDSSLSSGTKNLHTTNLHPTLSYTLSSYHLSYTLSSYHISCQHLLNTPYYPPSHITHPLTPPTPSHHLPSYASHQPPSHPPSHIIHPLTPSSHPTYPLTSPTHTLTPPTSHTLLRDWLESISLGSVMLEQDMMALLDRAMSPIGALGIAKTNTTNLLSIQKIQSKRI